MDRVDGGIAPLSFTIRRRRLHIGYSSLLGLDVVPSTDERLHTGRLERVDQLKYSIVIAQSDHGVL